VKVQRSQINREPPHTAAIRGLAPLQVKQATRASATSAQSARDSISIELKRLNSEENEDAGPKPCRTQ
jgi:hypothetical protein